MEPTKVASSQGTQPAHTTRSKAASQPAAVDASDPAAGGGFLALLAALGGGAEEEGVLSSVGTDVLAADGFPDVGSTAVDVSAVAAWQGLLGMVPADGAPPAAAGTDGGARLTAAFGAGGVPSPAGLGVEWTPFGRPQGLVAETAMLDSAADLKDAQPLSATSTAGRTFSRLQSVAAPRPGLSGSGDAGVGQGALGGVKPHLSGHLSTAATLSQAVSERAAQASLTGAQPSERAGGPSSISAGVEGVTPVADGLLVAAASAHAPEFSAGGRSNGENSGNGGSWSESASGASPVEAGNFADAAVLADPNALGAEEQVAEQVAYWVNQKTQNAELTLQRDGQPVEVSVSLSGNEAHVSFRSDQQQTRELLDQSMAQLSDLLRSEGLVLSGMSVGTSARDSAGGGEERQQRPQSGARQARVVSAAPAGSALLARGGGATDRAVDVFV